MLALLAPGQGSQTPGMLSPWLELPGAAERIAAWSEIIGLDLARLGTTATAEEITDTVGHAAARRRRHAAGTRGTDQARPAGRRRDRRRRPLRRRDRRLRHRRRASPPTTPCSLAATRGSEMAKACAVEPTGMAAVLGGDEAEVLARLDALDLVPANRNAAGQIVAAGALSALDKLAEDPPAKARVRELATAGAFHTHFMASALDGYSAAADGVTAGEPTTTLLSNADGQPVASAADAMTKLVAQLTRPVRWDLCTETMRQREVTAIIEFPPAGTLVGHRQTRTSGSTDVRRQDPRRPGRARRALSQYNRTPARPTGHANPASRATKR